MNNNNNLFLLKEDQKKTTIQNVIVSSTQRLNITANTNIPYGILFDTNVNIFGYRLNAISFKKNYDLCIFSMLVQQFGFPDKNISIIGSFTPSEFCSKLQQQLIANTTSFINCNVAYDNTTGKISITGYSGTGTTITLTISDKKSQYYVGNANTTVQSFVFNFTSDSTWTMSGYANFCYFPPNFYITSYNLSQGNSVYRTNVIAVFTDSKIADHDNNFNWITLENISTDFKYIKESQLTEIDFNIYVEDLDNLNQLRLLNFNYGDISGDFDLL